jgi:antibiotic biosynthesis monooxygenase (ABM) superfamily enzyme
MAREWLHKPAEPRDLLNYCMYVSVCTVLYDVCTVQYLGDGWSKDAMLKLP